MIQTRTRSGEVYIVSIQSTDGEWEDWKETDSLATAKAYAEAATQFSGVKLVEITAGGWVKLSYDVPS